MLLALLVIPIFLWGIYFVGLIIYLFQSGLVPEAADKDFVNYWLGGKMLVEGMTDKLYDFETHNANIHATLISEVTRKNWSYPPHILLLLFPLGFMSYKLAYLVFFVAGLCFYLLATTSLYRSFIAEKTPPLIFYLAQLPFIFWVFFFTQNGLFTASLCLFGVLFCKKNPILSGLYFALLTTKPQLGVMIPFLLIALGAWRAIAFSALFSIAFIALSVVVLGVDDWVMYYEQAWPYQKSVMHDWDGLFLNMTPSLFATLRVWGVDSYLAQNIHFVFLVIAAGPVLWALFEAQNEFDKFFIAILGTFILLPYSFNYDLGVFVALCSTLLVHTIEQKNKAYFLWSGLLFYLAFYMQLSLSGLPITPFVLVALFIAIILFLLRKDSDLRSFHPEHL